MATEKVKDLALITAIVLALLILFVQTLQISSIKNQISANAVKEGIDMRGWTDNEKMMYEHHGTLPSRMQNSKQASMVGGC